MAKNNRLRCPHCGICYEGDLTASNAQLMTCENCGSSIRLQEEDPDGFFSGALPPLPRLIALGSAILFSLIAIRIPFFSTITFGILIYLSVDIFQAHKKQRQDRIILWDKLRTRHAELKQKNEKLTTDLLQTKENLDDISSRYENISPEKRDQLAEEIQTQQNTLSVLGDLTKMTTIRNQLQAVISELKSRIVSLEEEEMLQSFGFYKPLYSCADSTAYRQLLENVRSKQKNMIKEGDALWSTNTFSVPNDKASGKKIAKNLEKMILRAFNGECDSIIDKVTFSNLDTIGTRIKKAYQDLNDLSQPVGISITQSYLNTKIEELHICYEYQRKLKEEREEQRKIREEMREQARLAKEIEDARKKIEKEETHFNQAIAELHSRMEAAAASERAQYEAKLQEYQEKLAAVQKDKDEVAFREQSTRAGYVYIISNIGSFGENAYKIGVTRRLDPQERVDELGDASVPFEFDVHAMIFSEDAPTLEGALHEHFADRKINKINPRKEFFHVTLDEIEEVVRTHHNKVVEFTRIAKAEDYRMTLAQEREHNATVISS